MKPELIKVLIKMFIGPKWDLDRRQVEGGFPRREGCSRRGWAQFDQSNEPVCPECSSSSFGQRMTSNIADGRAPPSHTAAGISVPQIDRTSFCDQRSHAHLPAAEKPSGDLSIFPAVMD